MRSARARVSNSRFSTSSRAVARSRAILVGDGGRTGFTALLSAVRNLPALAGFCYTQFADTYQEANGLLTMDRTPKIPIEHVSDAVRGPRQSRQAQASQVREQIQRAERGAPGVQHDAGAP